MLVSSVWVGALSALCTCTGLALVRRLPRTNRHRGLFTMGAAGLALFIVIETGYQALGTVELGAVSDAPGALALSGGLMLTGLLFGLVGLAWIETRRGEPGAEVPQPLDVAIMLAAGIGLHSFAEGLTVGQSLATSLNGLGLLFLLGLAVHGAVDGAAVAAPVVGQPMPPARLLLLAAIAAGPPLLGVIMGTTWVGPGLELLVLSVAAGTLVYVLRELLRARLESVGAVAAMWALAVGLLIGLGTDVLTEMGRARSQFDGPIQASVSAPVIALSPGSRDDDLSALSGTTPPTRPRGRVARRPSTPRRPVPGRSPARR